MRDGDGSEWLEQTVVGVVGTQASSPTPSVSQLGLWSSCQTRGQVQRKF